MNIIEKKVLHEGYGADGKSVILAELANTFAIYYYIHAEDRYFLIDTADSNYEAKEMFDREIKRHEIQESILRVAQKRVERGATKEHIRFFQEKLLQKWFDPDIRQFIEHLDRMVFEE